MNDKALCLVLSVVFLITNQAEANNDAVVVFLVNGATYSTVPSLLDIRNQVFYGHIRAPPGRKEIPLSFSVATGKHGLEHEVKENNINEMFQNGHFKLLKRIVPIWGLVHAGYYKWPLAQYQYGREPAEKVRDYNDSSKNANHSFCFADSR